MRGHKQAAFSKGSSRNRYEIVAEGDEHRIGVSGHARL
jgi:hypothetical protein